MTSNSTFGYLPQNLRTFIQKDIFIPLLIGALRTITKIWNQPNVSICKWIMKVRYIYTMNYYTAERNDRILYFDANLLKLDDMLSDVSQKNKKN